jgi:replicative DNA helicase
MEHQTYTIEQSILSAILAENSALEIIDGKLTSDDFSDPRNGFIFKELVATISRGEYIDALVLNNMLVAKYNEKGSEITKHVSEINSEIGCSTHNIIHYAKQVREMSVVRRLLKASNDIKAFVDNRGDCTVDDLLAKADNVLQSVISGHSNTDIKLITATEAIDNLVSDMAVAGTRSGLTGICTSIKKLNLKTNGLQKGNMIIVAGPASMGKTTFAMNLVRRAAETQKYPTVVFSMEMPYIDIIRRYASSQSRVNYNEYRVGTFETEQSYNRMSDGLVAIKKHKLILCDNSSLNISIIRSTLKRVKREYGGLSCAMLDYVQMVDGIEKQGGNRNTELTIISRELKKMAREFEIPFIVLSQLSKDVEKAQRKPTNGDLRESGALAQDADVIMMVHREEKYKPDAENIGKASIIITKSRNGECGEVICGFDGSTFTFYDLEGDTK